MARPPNCIERWFNDCTYPKCTCVSAELSPPAVPQAKGDLLVKALREHQGDADIPWRHCIQDAAADAVERLRQIQEEIAKAVEQSAFYYSGTCATKLVPSASGEAATHVVAAYIRSLDLSGPR